MVDEGHLLTGGFGQKMSKCLGCGVMLGFVQLWIAVACICVHVLSTDLGSLGVTPTFVGGVT